MTDTVLTERRRVSICRAGMNWWNLSQCVSSSYATELRHGSTSSSSQTVRVSPRLTAV